MKDEAIPEDIQSAALRALAKAESWLEAAETVAAAIFAERERCAKIAEDSNSWPAEGAEIAAEIRAPR